MRRRENEFRDILAYVAPFLLYVAPTMLESAHVPGLHYELLCTLKGLLAGAAFWAFRRRYPAISTAGFGLSIVAGSIGFVLWIMLEKFQRLLPGIQQLSGWLQLGNRVGFDPFSNDGPSATTIAFVVVRLIELSIIVPLAEEVFWRGFLARFLIADDFENVRQGTFTTFSFFVVTLAFASVHPELLAAIVWCVLINALYRKTANLWACVLMHAVTNTLLGAYILVTRNWRLW